MFPIMAHPRSMRSAFPAPAGSAGAAHFAGAESLARSRRAEALRAEAEGGAARRRSPPSAETRVGTGSPAGDWPRPPAALVAARLDEPPAGARITVCGLVLVRQRPGSAKGVLFLTLEDETGVVNVVVWTRVYEAHRRAVIAGRLLRVTGRLQREGAVTHVVAETIEDVSDLLDALAAGRFEPEPARADEVRRPQRDPRGG
ncbi:MAG: hypothetical protein EA355_03365 [Rhodobacteraceae bacterium]|nr:MAG: hypothetical protein EA355_03365 [Paracoccaceae bacterium]